MKVIGHHLARRQLEKERHIPGESHSQVSENTIQGQKGVKPPLREEYPVRKPCGRASQDAAPECRPDKPEKESRPDGQLASPECDEDFTEKRRLDGHSQRTEDEERKTHRQPYRKSSAPRINMKLISNARAVV